MFPRSGVMVFDVLPASLHHLRDALPAAAAVIVSVELLSRPRVIVMGLTIVIRYLKSEARAFLVALRELREELTHWNPPPAPPNPPMGPADHTSVRR